MFKELTNKEMKSIDGGSWYSRVLGKTGEFFTSVGIVVVGIFDQTKDDLTTGLIEANEKCHRLAEGTDEF